MEAEEQAAFKGGRSTWEYLFWVIQFEKEVTFLLNMDLQKDSKPMSFPWKELKQANINVGQSRKIWGQN